MFFFFKKKKLAAARLADGRYSGAGPSDGRQPSYASVILRLSGGPSLPNDVVGPSAGLRRAQSLAGLVLETGTPRSPPLASKLHSGPPPARRRSPLVALGRAVRGDLRGEPDPVQQVRRAPQRVADVEQPPDQRGDPLQGPPLVLGPSPRPPGPYPARRAAGPAAPGSSRHTAPPAPLDASAAVAAGPPATAATDRPTSCSPAASATCTGLTSCSNIRRGLQPHLLPPRPSPQRSGHHHRDISYIPA